MIQGNISASERGQWIGMDYRDKNECKENYRHGNVGEADYHDISATDLREIVFMPFVLMPFFFATLHYFFFS